MESAGETHPIDQEISWVAFGVLHDDSKRRSVAPSDPEIGAIPQHRPNDTLPFGQTTFLVQSRSHPEVGVISSRCPWIRRELLVRPPRSSDFFRCSCAVNGGLSLTWPPWCPNPRGRGGYRQQTALTLWEKFDSLQSISPSPLGPAGFALNKTPMGGAPSTLEGTTAGRQGLAENSLSARTPCPDWRSGCGT